MTTNPEKDSPPGIGDLVMAMIATTPTSWSAASSGPGSDTDDSSDSDFEESVPEPAPVPAPASKSTVTISSVNQPFADPGIYMHLDPKIAEGIYLFDKSKSKYDVPRPVEGPYDVWVLKDKFELDLEPLLLLKDHGDWLTVINKYTTGPFRGKAVFIVNSPWERDSASVKAYQIVSTVRRILATDILTKIRSGCCKR